MSSGIANLIAQNQKILLIPKQALDLDVLYSSLSLAIALEEMTKNVSVFSSNKLTPDFKNIFSYGQLNVIDLSSLQSVVLSLSNFNSEIRDVTWEQRKDKIDIFIDTKSGQKIPDELKLKLRKNEFDLTILVGFANPQELGELYTDYAGFFAPEKTIVINSKPQEGVFSYKHFPVFTPTLAQSIYHFIRENNLPITSDSASALMTAIIAGTQGFQTNTSNNVFSVMSKLIKLGGDLEKAKSTALDTWGENELKYLQEVLGNYKQLTSGVFYSIVNSTEGKITSFSDLKLANKIPLLQIAGCKLAFVILDKGDNREILLHSKDVDLDFRRFVNKFNGQGHKSGGVLFTTQTVAEFLETFSSELKFLSDNYFSTNVRESSEVKVEEEPEKTIPEIAKKDAELQETLSGQLSQIAEVDEKVTKILDDLAIEDKVQDTAEKNSQPSISSTGSNLNMNFDPLQPAVNFPLAMHLDNSHSDNGSGNQNSPLPPVSSNTF